MTTSRMTTLLKDEVLELLRGGDSITYDPSGNLFALTTDVPVDATYTKVAGFGYTDLVTTMVDWSPPANRVGMNAAEFVFPAVDNAGDIDAVAYAVKGGVIERATTGEALYTQGVTSGYSYRHGDEASFPVGWIDLTFNHTPDRIGTDLVNAIYNATLRGQTLNSVGTFNLEFLSNIPGSDGLDTVLDIPPIELPAAAGTWLAPALASTYRTAEELAALNIPIGARAIVNATELRSETLEREYPSIGGIRIVTPTNEVWWRAPISPKKFVYENAQLKILPQTILLAI